VVSIADHSAAGPGFNFRCRQWLWWKFKIFI